MKKIANFIFTIMVFASIQAQIEDSVNMSANFTMDVFYSLENGTAQSLSNTEWTVAFSTPSQTASIYINDAQGVTLYETNVDVANFSNVLDTSGISSWTPLHNGYEDWDHSAFEVGATGHPDYGWGYYTGSPNHDLVGNKVFVLKTLNGTFYKVYVEIKHAGEWKYNYAHLDNSFDTTITYLASNLTESNFAYLNMENHLISNREPSNTAWDLLFTEYYDENVANTVVGVLNNKGVEVVQVDGINHTDATYVNETFNNETNSIGSDWKQANNSIVDSRTYFIKQLDGDIYKLYFTRHDGLSTGKTVFSKELLISTNIQELSEISVLTLYPNPAKTKTQIIVDSKTKRDVEIQIFNILGSKTFQKNATVHSGLNYISINTESFERGIYFVQVDNQQVLKLNIEK